jgi:diguanylate cyclase (GGDEF)-like protein/hemerythrin-like metal-binding protein
MLSLFMLLAAGGLFVWIGYQNYHTTHEQNYRLLEVRARQHGARIDASLRSVNALLENISTDLQEAPLMSIPEQNRLLEESLRQLPELRDLLLTNAAGQVTASNTEGFIGFNAVDREYFTAHSDNRQASRFHISRPFVSIQGISSVTLSRPLRDRDGQFAGTVVANLNPRFFDDVLRPDRDEPSLAVTLINVHGDILNQYPPTTSGDTHVQGGLAFAEHRASGKPTTRHLSRDTMDDEAIMAVFHDLPGEQLVVVVAEKYRGVIASWKKELALHIAGFTLLCGFTIYLLRLLAQRQTFVQDVIDSVSNQIAVINPKGMIVMTNHAWRCFALENCVEPGKQPPKTEIGANYLAVCKDAAAHSSDGAMTACEGIQAVISGRLPQFSLEYPCHSPTTQRWFIMQAAPLGLEKGAVIVHNDITMRKQAELALLKTNRRLEALSCIDGLTNISNRRHFDEVLRKEYTRHSRSGGELSLILLDIDYFKLYNDHYGHLQGDECLRQVGRLLAGCVLRSADLAARYGGEEFVCILPDTDHAGAVMVAEKIRRGIMELAIPHTESRAAAVVTVSLGVVTDYTSKSGSAEALLEQADILLYQAKAQGRNRVVSRKLSSQAGEVKNALLQLVWSEDFCSGNGLIDAQHQALFKLANQLFESIQAGLPKAEVLHLVEKLFGEIRQHFHDEEVIVTAVGFPDSEYHAREHVRLVEHGLVVIDKFSRDQLPITDFCSFLVNEVVMHHLLRDDRQFFRYLKAAASAPGK